MSHTKILLERKRANFWLAFLWTLFITVLSLINSSSLPDVSISNIDKLVHAIFFFILTIVWFLFFKSTRKKKIFVDAISRSIILAAFLGVCIEIAQEFLTEDRTGDLMDIVADLFGTVIAIPTCYLYYNRYLKVKEITKNRRIRNFTIEKE